MRYYPVFLDIRKKPCVVVGGGAVAQRKALCLLSAGASVTVISPRVTKALKTLADRNGLTIIKRKYRPGDLAGSLLAISATDSEEVNRAVFEEATLSNVLVNVVDDPAHCGFIVPSVIDRGSLVIAISTSGKSPYLARALREGLEKSIGTEYGTFVEILGAVRKKLLKSGMTRDKKERVIKDLVKSSIPSLLKEGDTEEVNSVLKNIVGAGCSLSTLRIKIKE